MTYRYGSTGIPDHQRGKLPSWMPGLGTDTDVDVTDFRPRLTNYRQRGFRLLRWWIPLGRWERM